jgi:hypothetical protein
MIMFKRLAPFAVAAVIAIAVSTSSFAAPPTAPEKGKSTITDQKGKSATSEKTKKPGQSCDALNRTSDAYKDCVPSKAHDGKTPGAKAKGKQKSTT